MIELYTYSLGTIFLVGLAVILAASEIGWQLGSRGGGQEGGNVPTLESAMLGLLALIIGFTFAMALSRFEARRAAVLNEANAIGTTALRARLLPEPHRLVGLFGIAAIAGGFAGYASGLDPKRNRLPVYIVGFLVSAVILLIFDLDRPSSGFITNDQQSMIDVAASIGAFSD